MNYRRNDLVVKIQQKPNSSNLSIDSNSVLLPGLAILHAILNEQEKEKRFSSQPLNCLVTHTVSVNSLVENLTVGF